MAVLYTISLWYFIKNIPIFICSTNIYVYFQELELRIETQKQTLQARDESIKKLLEMLQNKGVGKCYLSWLYVPV